MARSNNDLTLQVGFDIDRFNKELAKTNSSLTKWGDSVVGSLRGFAAGFGALAIGRFVLDVSRLAGEWEGVNAAFVKLPNSIKLMQDLKQATGGTVSELELMKRSVMASNFDISLKALPQLLEFATLRARQTGQSVDYLVDSIVTGIGRKSKLILDNLGISAVQLTEALGGASAASSTIGEVADAVGRIASKNLIQMGKLTDDAAVRAARLGAEWANLKVLFGQIVNESGFSDFLVTVRRDLETIGKLKQLIFGGRLTNPMEEVQRQMSMFNVRIAGTSETDKTWLAQIELLAKEANVQLIKLTDSATGFSKIFFKPTPVNFLKPEIVQEQVRNVKFLEDSIATLNEEIKLSGSRSEISKYQKEIEGLQAEIDILLGKTKEAFSPDASWIFNKLGGGPNQNATTFEAMQGQAAPKIAGLNASGIESMQKALEKLTKISSAAQEQWDRGIAKALEHQQRMAEAAATMGNIIGSTIGDMTSGAATFANSIKEMAIQVLHELKRMAIGWVLLKAAQKGFGPVGIALAVAGISAVEAGFRGLLDSGGSAGSGGLSGSDRRWMKKNNPQIISQMGNNVTFTIRGQELHGVLENYGRVNRRTGT